MGVAAASAYDAQDGNAVIYGPPTLEVYGEPLVAGMRATVPGGTTARTGLQFRPEASHHPIVENFC